MKILSIMNHFKCLFLKPIGKINKRDKLGRKQGLWVIYYANGNIWFKDNWLNGNRVNYLILFEFDNVFLEDIFIYEIF